MCVCFAGVGDIPATRPGLFLADLGPAGKLNHNLASFPGPALFLEQAYCLHTLYTEMYMYSTSTRYGFCIVM